MESQEQDRTPGDDEIREIIKSIAQSQPRSHGKGVRVDEYLIKLIKQRTELGVEKYGEPLTTENGRNPMLDALQESIDLNQYLMQIILEEGELTRRLTDWQEKSNPAMTGICIICRPSPVFGGLVHDEDCPVQLAERISLAIRL